MKTRAAVAREAGKPLSLETIDLDGPREGEVLVEIKATGICHTDEFTLSGGDPEGLFPSVLGHEGAGVVVDVGKNVTSLKKGDRVIPLYTPECRQCEYCLSRKTNLCVAIRATQGRGVMPDGTSRFSSGKDTVYHYMGTSTFSNFTVLPEIALAKIREDAPFDKVCYIGCGVTTGLGAVMNTAKVEAGARCVVFGLGGIGLNVVQGLRMVGAEMIVGVDLNPGRKAMAEKFGMTHFVNPAEVDGDLGETATGAILPIAGGSTPGTWTGVNGTGALSARQGHSAVWTGNKILYFGGKQGSTFLGDGAAFDPANNTWTALPSLGAPSARSAHAAVWTGSEMVIYGGETAAGTTATAAAFNPTTGLWRTLSNGGGPQARSFSSAFWTGTELMLFGGLASGSPLAALQRLDPQPAWYLYRKP